MKICPGQARCPHHRHHQFMDISNDRLSLDDRHIFSTYPKPWSERPEDIHFGDALILYAVLPRLYAFG